MPPDNDLITSAFRRFTKLGGLAGRVGASLLASRIADVARGDVARAAHHTEVLVRNAERVAETLGQMKGGAMKVGQMLSLHADLLPPEVGEVLRTLQAKAPAVPAEVMEFEVRGELKNFDALFGELRARGLRGGVDRPGAPRQSSRRAGGRGEDPVPRDRPDHPRRPQEPARRVPGRVRALQRRGFRPDLAGVRERLLEELDYVHEAATIERMRALHAGVPEIVIPGVVREATTARVLTMERVDGIPPDEACSGRYDAELRDRWGRTLFEFAFRGLFVHRLLHADPNLSNFAFLPDGRVVVYDFGCVKDIPAAIATGYAKVMRAAIDGRKADVPGILRDMGVGFADGSPLPPATTTPFVELFTEVLRADPPYTFGSEPTIYARLFDLGLTHARDASQLRFPGDVVFVNRTLSGHFGNLARLRATGRWRELALGFVG